MRILLAASCVFLAVVLLSPSSGAQSSAVGTFADVLMSVGVPDAWVSPARTEFLCNVLIIVPVTALGSLIWPRLGWQAWTAYAFIGAGLVELTQGVLLPGRSATFSDVVANTLGALVGAVVAEVILRRRGAARP